MIAHDWAGAVLPPQTVLPPQKRMRSEEPGQRAMVVDAARCVGKCLWFDMRRKYGAILPDTPAGAPHIFVHANDIEGELTLNADDRVEFSRGQCPKGRAKAANVVITARSGLVDPYAQQRHQQQQQGALQQQQMQQPGYGSAQGAYGGANWSPQAYGMQQQQQQQQQQQHQQRGQNPNFASPMTMNGNQMMHRGGAGAVPAVAARLLGRVKWFDNDTRHYGFLVPADGSVDVYCHATEVVKGVEPFLEAMATLVPGDAVEYSLMPPVQRGKPPRAHDVKKLIPVDAPNVTNGTAVSATAATDAAAGGADEEPLFDGNRITGVVMRFDPVSRYGFIKPDDPAYKAFSSGGTEFFIHSNDVLDAEKTLQSLDLVEFSVMKSLKSQSKCRAVECKRRPSAEDADAAVEPATAESMQELQDLQAAAPVAPTIVE